MSSPLDVLNKSSNESVSGLMIAVIILIVPFIFDTINNFNDSFICPHDHFTIYGVVILISPALFIFFVGLVVIFYIKPSGTFDPNTIIALIILGITFIRGNYYACIVLGPDTNFISLDPYKTEFDNQNTISQMIGWAIILSSALLVVVAILIQKAIEEYDMKRKLYLLFKLEFEKERDKLLEVELTRMADQTVEYLFSSLISANTNNSLNYEGVKEFVDQWFTIQKRILDENLIFLSEFSKANKSNSNNN